MLLYGWQENALNKKRASLLSYWLRDYVKYLKNEIEFNPSSLKEYSRGDIVKVNLGFNVGSEEGGLHYAIVVNNCNARHAPTINVIPLTSKKEDKKVHEDEVFLGNEIYEKLNTKYQHENSALTNKISKLEERNEYLEDKIAEFFIMINEVEKTDVSNQSKNILRDMLSDIEIEASDIKQELKNAKKALQGIERLIREIAI